MLPESDGKIVIAKKTVVIVNQYLYDEGERIERLEKAVRACLPDHLLLDRVDFRDLSTANSLHPSSHGLILSGRDSRGRDEATRKDLVLQYSKEREFLERYYKPVLGICFGSQFLSLAHGEKLRSIGKHHGWQQIRLLTKEDPLLAGVPEVFDVFEAHTRAIISPAKNFDVLAETLDGEPQIIRSRKQGFHYGFQFHPEIIDAARGNSGPLLVANFLHLIETRSQEWE